MAKGNNSKRGNKEAKKPKQEKPKVSATANSLDGKPALGYWRKEDKVVKPFRISSARGIQLRLSCAPWRGRRPRRFSKRL